MAQVTPAADKAAKADKPDSKKGFRLEDNVRMMTEASVELASGSADAVSKGVRAFGDAVADGDITRFDAKNGVIHGAFEGCARTLEEAPKVVRKAYDVLTRDLED